MKCIALRAAVRRPLLGARDSLNCAVPSAVPSLPEPPGGDTGPTTCRPGLPTRRPEHGSWAQSIPFLAERRLPMNRAHSRPRLWRRLVRAPLTSLFQSAAFSRNAATPRVKGALRAESLSVKAFHEPRSRRRQSAHFFRPDSRPESQRGLTSAATRFMVREDVASRLNGCGFAAR
jgi:hypothetical protein